LSLDLLAVQDQILEQLSELPQEFFTTAVPDDTKVKHGANGLFLPYGVVLFSDVMEARSGKGITSTRQNPGVSYCVVQCHAPTDRAARQLANIVRDKLAGFQPTDAGQLRLAGGRSYGDVENNAVPKKYISDVAFTFIVNTVVS
jgi:hypothetical protein